ncbi:hypothetical protein A1O1_08126, partial [Capronia coronata CBS 617.96]
PNSQIFSPQPQYIMLTPPMLQPDGQKQIPPAEEVAQTSVKKTRSLRKRSSPERHTIRSGRLEQRAEIVRRDSSSDEDWEAWRQQFREQLRERRRRCQIQGADCSSKSR